MTGFTEEYLKQQNDFFSAPAARIAHVIIDVQADLCQYSGFWKSFNNLKANKQTDAIAQRIASTSQRLRQLCDETFIVYYDDEHEGIERAHGGLYAVTLQPGDVPVPKTHNDAFASSDIKSKLENRDITHLLVSGFYANMCVKETVVSALKDFNVAVMDDLIGEASYLSIAKGTTAMSKAGALKVSSNSTLDHLEKRHKLPNLALAV